MVPRRTLLTISAAIMILTTGSALNPATAQGEELEDGIQNVDIIRPELESVHAGATTENVVWTTEPPDRQGVDAFWRYKIQMFRVSDGALVFEETLSAQGIDPCNNPGSFTTLQQTCSFEITFPLETDSFDIHVKTVDHLGNERCDFRDGLFQPCDQVRVRVKAFVLDINVYEVCTRETLDLHCVGHPAYNDHQQVDVPADEEAVVSIHASGLTKPNFEGFEGHVNVTGKLRCVDGQPCVDLGGGISRATHQVWADGHPADGGSFPDVGTEFTTQARDIFVEGPALGECHTLDIHVFVETDTHARTDDGTLTLCGV